MWHYPNAWKLACKYHQSPLKNKYAIILIWYYNYTFRFYWGFCVGLFFSHAHNDVLEFPLAAEQSHSSNNTWVEWYWSFRLTLVKKRGVDILWNVKLLTFLFHNYSYTIGDFSCLKGSREIFPVNVWSVCLSARTQKLPGWIPWNLAERWSMSKVKLYFTLVHIQITLCKTAKPGIGFGVYATCVTF